MTWGSGDVVWEDGPVDASAMKLIEIEVGKAIPGERAEHKPPGFGHPRDNRRRFRARAGRAGEHGGFAPGERDAAGHDPLQVGSEHDMEDLDLKEVDRRRHVAPGEDGHEPNPGGKGIPPDQDHAEQGGQQSMRDAIEYHEHNGAAGTGNLPEDVAIAPKALMPGRVTRDFPGWRYDRALATHYSRTLASCGVLVDTEAIADSWLAVHKAEGQTPPGGDPKPWIAAQVSRWSVSLRQMLNELWREGWFLGAESGRAVARTSAPDWGDWSPGNPSAARIVRTAKDLKRWLDTYGIATIRAIEENRMGELAARLHRSLEEGWATRRLADEIEDVLMNPKRAGMIARTETARAVSQGTLAEYRHAGVERVMWVTADDATVCPPCDANEAMGAVPTGSVFSGTMTDAPPGHPNCRCAIVAVPDGMEVPVREPMVVKVGPKGYIHGWIYVGARKTGLGDWEDEHLQRILATHRQHESTAPFGGHSNDAVLEEIARHQGFDAKPNQGELDPNAEILHRGFGGIDSDPGTGAEHAAQWANGKYRAGTGIRGNGSYFSTNAGRAANYGHQVQVQLHPDAKVARLRDLEDQLDSLPDGPVKEIVGDDAGRLAALLGYDAIHAGNTRIVLNRGAVRMKGSAVPANPTGHDLTVVPPEHVPSLSHQQWMSDPNPDVRAVNMWSNRKYDQEAIRSQFRGESYEPRFSPIQTFEMDNNYNTIETTHYDVDDYKKDVTSAADWLKRQLAAAEPTDRELYRGMAFDLADPDSAAALMAFTTPGNTFTNDVASWTTGQDHARQYSRQWGQYMKSSRSVTVRLAPGANAVDIDGPAIVGATKGTGEHLAAGRYRVVAVHEQTDGADFLVDVEEVGRD